uniref:RNA-directed DNA polymerase, eukaryota, reverse transcriptase zinc-binding domain protein n=1 Tax=Tanacetum cinerariifolium TaxID=118510 RepID=A0A6L2P4K5_TANCI|nr:RNA-directed DNA polymerase, eukaryota, reverse transcriptase zinc-binding domain protein [Tanacetum cinerariifolium]
MVLDDSCIIERDFSNHVMGKVNDFHSINDLHTLIKDEGYANVKILYLGGLWRGYLFTLGHRLCIITKHSVSILEFFKIIVKGKVFMVRAKELFMWTPNCIVEKEVVYSSDNDSVQDADQSQNNDESGDDNGSDINGMADDKFDGNPVPPLNSTDEHEVQQSKDPFELYDLLKKNKTRKEIRDPSPSLSYPPGFTPLCYQATDKHGSHLGGRQHSGHNRSYASAVNGGISRVQPTSLISPSPAMVLDDSCIIERDFSNHVMGKVNDFYSINDLHTLIKDEGFANVKILYLGGLWVMLEFDNGDVKSNFMQHIGVKSWFNVIQEVSQKFVSDERIVWVDLEGIPIHAWSPARYEWLDVFVVEDPRRIPIKQIQRAATIMPGRGRPRNTRQGDARVAPDDRNEETDSDSVIWDDDFDGEENPFGRPQPDEFIDWLSTVERVFDLRDIPDHLKFKEGGEEPVMPTRTPWLSVIDYFNVDGGILTGCFGEVKKFLKNGKLEKVVTVMKSCTPNGLADLIVTVKDLSCTIYNTIHYKVLTERCLQRQLA